MKNSHKWRPTKYVLDSSGRLRASQVTTELAVSSRLVAQLVADALQPAPTSYARGRILDLGRGRVPLYECYQPRATCVTCADWPQSLHENEHVDVLCDVGRELPFRDEIADTVISTDVIEHLPDPTTAFREFSPGPVSWRCVGSQSPVPVSGARGPSRLPAPHPVLP